MLDKTDFEILKLLNMNARMQFRDIGENVHLTGQAVAKRISRMEKLNVIKGYTVLLDEKALGKNISAYVTVFMKTTRHTQFKTFLRYNEIVKEAHRISGDGCYLLKTQVSCQDELDSFLDSILEYGNYRLNISIDKIK